MFDFLICVAVRLAVKRHCKHAHKQLVAPTGVAVSSDGIAWTRGYGAVEGTREADDVGSCMEANPGDWWTLDTHSVGTPDVQMFSSDAVNSGSGVYWMFYTGMKMLHCISGPLCSACHVSLHASGVHAQLSTGA